jgi:hypothetical protein
VSRRNPGYDLRFPIARVEKGVKLRRFLPKGGHPRLDLAKLDLWKPKSTALIVARLLPPLWTAPTTIKATSKIVTSVAGRLIFRWYARKAS